ncbi:hypothetical protein EG850_12735 [Gulosibacter macacae]|uniref:Uncharacterized protein n=1 Tax=Gulosibacter macacae TaxID=2488791 RepID=A0A3P3VS18_9MICO|nr:hypothetical protein [Gulosibacter macacae]RRJ85582.1 hypothetical protein EG850_12735 [Gulosibacter macacae]
MHEFDRDGALVLCEFAEGDDSLAIPEEVRAEIRPASAALPPEHGVEHVAALDLDPRRDLTPLVVGPAESRSEGPIFVIAWMHWRPADGAEGRAHLVEVEAAAFRQCHLCQGAWLRFDSMQAEQLTAILDLAGVRSGEFMF